MGFIDIILGGLILYGAVRGLMKGLFVEVASLVALIVGVYGAIHFSYFVGDYLSSRVNWEEKYINLAAFAITFVVIIITVSLAGKLLTKIADFASLGILNKILGAVFGGLKFAVILGAVLVFFDKTNNTVEFIKKETIENSALYHPVKSIGAFVFKLVLKEGQEEEV
ncbi:CvpA family protein [Abyssalbus ytuae]|uniref:CvpA family protein n=1 Tax=Abyssalbus ytuae TaxID=2926907 RepID=A0A9E6ZWV0_9FLAO|nr:CvpA family protein [Abyssalbus ytuae]UOB19228.1 CvpA family protein [Abyssalbus ytuae]